jgi:hypothetical protein
MTEKKSQENNDTTRVVVLDEKIVLRPTNVLLGRK